MNCKLWFLIVVWSQLPTDTHTQGCPPEKFGDCNTSNGQHDNDTEVRPLCSLNCDFQNDLCDYRQGCRDDGMTTWQVVNGSAKADQESAACGRLSFSMLESRWVNFSTTTDACLQFTVTRRLPYALDVFLKSYVDHNDVRMVMNRSLTGDEEGQFTYNFTLSHNLTVAKLLFRLYGGGGFSGDGKRRLLLLHSVSIVEGSCETRDCYVVGRPPPCPGWDLVRWQNRGQSGSAFVSVGISNNNHQPATLTIPISRPPVHGENADCLTFRYRVLGLNSALNVSVRLLTGLTMTVWSLVGRGDGNDASWLNATVPVNVTSAYWVMFDGRINQTTEDVSLTSVTIKANTPCGLFPPDADTGQPVPSGWWSTWSECSPATTTTEHSTTAVSSQQTTPTPTTTAGYSSSSQSQSPSSLPASSTSSPTTTSFSTTQPSTPSSSSHLPVTASPFVLSVEGSRYSGDSDERATTIGVTVGVVLVVAVVSAFIIWKWHSKRRQRYSVHKEDINGAAMTYVSDPAQSS